MRHLQLTTRNYAGFTTVMLAVGLMNTGFDMVDLLMVAPKGASHLAAVGQGSVILLGVSAFFFGIVQVFAGRLAVAEGEGSTARRLPVLAVTLLLTLVLCQLIALAVAAVTEPALGLFGQHRDLIPLVGSYLEVRLYGAAVAVLYVAAREALKICGAKNRSLAALVVGLGVNALFDWAFLYTGLARSFSSPETAVATATMIAQAAMTGLAAWMFAAQMRARGYRFARPARTAVWREFRSTTVAGAGVGVREVNDYLGSIVPMMFIGTMGVGTLAASVVAVNIYSVFCRVPQACFQATFVYYGYAVGQSGPSQDGVSQDGPSQDGVSQDGAGRAGTIRKLLIYSAIPTTAAALLVVATSPWLVTAFASPGLDRGLAVILLLAYLLYLPAYLFDQSLTAMLIVHQRGLVLFASSTLATYLLTVPLAWYAVFELHSAFLAVASNGVATAVQALISWRMLRGEVRGGEVRMKPEVLVA
jgi:Na+-driven multidrug efflux pump